MDRWIVVVLATLNMILGFMFAHGISGQDGSWRWPWNWLRVLANWVGTKAAFFAVGIAFCWFFGIVGFQTTMLYTGWHIGGWLKMLYVGPLALFDLAQLAVVVYWFTGRAMTPIPIKENGA